MNYAFKTEVTERHIAHGRRKACNRCPIALSAIEALAPALRQLKNASVKVSATGVLRIWTGDTFVAFRAAWAERFITRFDSSQHVAPTTLYWELMQ